MNARAAGDTGPSRQMSPTDRTKRGDSVYMFALDAGGIPSEGKVEPSGGGAELTH